MQSSRPAVKQRSSNWKQKLREDCKKLAERRRSDVLAQHRGSCSPEQIKSLINEGVRAAVRDELQRQLLADGETDSSDIDNLLAELEQQVLADVRHHLAALEQYEQEALQDQVAYIEQLQQQQHHHPQEHAAQQQQQHPQLQQQQQQQAQQSHTGGASPSLLCPVCQRANLVVRHGCLVCPAEGYVLNVSAEGLGLEDLQRRLQQVHQEHAARSCPGQLAFSVECLVPGEPAVLLATCTRCNLLEVVL